MEVKLYVGNLSYETSEEDLRSLFAQVGEVASVALIKDRGTGQSKGFAFITMGNQKDAQTAITKYNGFSLKERALTVNTAKERDDRPSFGNSSNRGGNHKPRGGRNF